MASPCPRCGHTKTESVKHGFIHDKLWDLGFHLRRCSFCNRRRLFKRHDRNQRHPDDMTVEELQESFNRKIAETLKHRPADSGAREGHMSSHSSEETHGPGPQPSVSSVGVAEVFDEAEAEDYPMCPKCGSSLFRRSRRRWYERMVRRPKMARCMKCDHRFPYPH